MTQKYYIACKAGGLRNGWEAGGTVYHAVPVGADAPLCGGAPAIRWRSKAGVDVTCDRCLARLKATPDAAFIAGAPQPVAF